MRKIVVAGLLALLTTSAGAQVSNEKWNEESCAQAMLGFKNPDDLSQKVAEYRAKIAGGDKSQETEDVLIFYRDLEWYCLKL
ncbi:hypothetical protein [Rhizobium sp. MHM7A]|uniref:hypothetical protein n=1 Tax=Rhizobium sp. MHM7A TaxID=2583233 RepID=UPI001106C536|nr:hypothetical protein [Rhizobium sp. MHM7A]TLX16600.1 hypothetical protein FFR93_04470 [Rhizobium sp. MHM7A]